jgi:hypothetical protein
MTETTLAPIAMWTSKPATIVKRGTMKMPLAIPSVVPKALAPAEMQKRAGTDAASISTALGRARNAAPGETRPEADLVASVVQLLVVDRPMS